MATILQRVTGHVNKMFSRQFDHPFELTDIERRIDEVLALMGCPVDDEWGRRDWLNDLHPKLDAREVISGIAAAIRAHPRYQDQDAAEYRERLSELLDAGDDRATAQFYARHRD